MKDINNKTLKVGDKVKVIKDIVYPSCTIAKGVIGIVEAFAGEDPQIKYKHKNGTGFICGGNYLEQGDWIIEEEEKVSSLHKDITYTTRENGDVSGMQFHSDAGREKFRQFQILNVLKAEATNTMGIRFYRGSIINVLKRYFPNIPRTRKGAYKYLVKNGYYEGFSK